MAYRVHLSDRAERALERVPTADARRIARAIEAMHADPFAGDVVRLKGTGAFRRRIGDYRIIFSVDHAGLMVAVFDIARRTTTTYR